MLPIVILDQNKRNNSIFFQFSKKMFFNFVKIFSEFCKFEKLSPLHVNLQKKKEQNLVNPGVRMILGETFTQISIFYQY